MITTTFLNYHLHYYSPFAAWNHMYRNNRKNIKHVDPTTHRDTKIIKHEVQIRERYTRVRGSPNPWATSTKPSHPMTFISFKNVTIHDSIVTILSLLFFSYDLLSRVHLSYSLLRSNYDLNSNKIISGILTKIGIQPSVTKMLRHPIVTKMRLTRNPTLRTLDTQQLLGFHPFQYTSYVLEPNGDALDQRLIVHSLSIPKNTLHRRLIIYIIFPMESIDTIHPSFNKQLNFQELKEHIYI